MKKILCIVFVLMLFSGCGMLNNRDVEKEPLIISGFNAVVSTEINDVIIKGKAEYYEGTDLIFQFISPKTLEGAKIICRDGEYKLEFVDISVSFPSEEMSYNMICKALKVCINNVQGKTPEIDAQSGMLIYNYSVKEHIYKLYAQPETKKFVKLAADGIDLLYFEDFEYIIE